MNYDKRLDALEAAAARPVATDEPAVGLPAWLRRLFDNRHLVVDGDGAIQAGDSWPLRMDKELVASMTTIANELNGARAEMGAPVVLLSAAEAGALVDLIEAGAVIMSWATTGGVKRFMLWPAWPGNGSTAYPPDVLELAHAANTAAWIWRRQTGADACPGELSGDLADVAAWLQSAVLME